MNRDDPRVKRTRKLIQQAFFELLAEKSFHQISVQDIAERATVNRTTFYAHFEDKYELYDQFVGDWFQEAVGSKVTSESPWSQKSLRLVILATLEALAAAHDHCRPTDRDLAPVFEARAQQELKAILLGWLAASRSDGSRPTETAATVMSWAIFGAALEWSRTEPRTPAKEMASQIFEAVSTGLPRPSEPVERRPRAAMALA
jgi:AcrR family transcriptional regulator